MRIISLTDIHGELEHLDRISGDLSGADLVTISGDITHFGKRRSAEKLIRALLKVNPMILAVPGNCDFPEVETCLSEEGLSIHLKTRTEEGVAFMGLGGSLPCPGATPNVTDEEMFESLLSFLVPSLQTDCPSVFVFHQPPRASVVDRISSGANVGSLAIRKAIEKVQPLLCLCGHIHEARGTENIGRTTVINPGPFHAGCYAVIEIGDKVRSVELKDAG